VPDRPSRTFVLVHDAWHGGWCWVRVADRLRAAGHRVFTPTLTGLGDRSHLLSPAVGLDTFIQDVVATLENERLADTILVGHSFGGVPITGAADRVPERIAHLVYLDAMLPQDGQSVFDLVAPELAAERRRQAQATSGGLSLPPPPASAFGIEAPADVEWLERRLRPHPLRGYEDRLRLRQPFGNGLPITYIACTEPSYALLLPIHAYARRQPGWRYLEMAKGHDAMVIAPDALTALLLRLT
jgi:pimeloyl-ACP methyl ester carboxylesterase